MKEIWARIGMTTTVTDKEYHKLRESAKSNDNEQVYDDIDVPEWLIKRFMEHGIPDGESYIPAACWEEVEQDETDIESLDIDELVEAADKVCLNCTQDTMNYESVCDTCPVRKTLNDLRGDMYFHNVAFATKEFHYGDIAKKLKEFGCKGSMEEVGSVLSETPDLPSKIVKAEHPEYVLQEAIETALSRNKLTSKSWWARLFNAGVRQTTCGDCSHYRSECFYCWEFDGQVNPNDESGDCRDFEGEYYSLIYDSEGDAIILNIELVKININPDIPAIIEILGANDSPYKEDIDEIKNFKDYSIGKWIIGEINMS